METEGVIEKTANTNREVKMTHKKKKTARKSGLDEKITLTRIVEVDWHEWRELAHDLALRWSATA